MSRTNANPKEDISGFTLIELVVAMSISAFLFAGILSGFTFLGRSLTRLVNTQDQETKSRRAFHIFSQDISWATQVTNGTDASLSLIIPATGGSTTSVIYAFDATAGTLTRTDNATSTVLLTNLTALDFNYYNGAGIALVLDASQQTPSKPSVLGVKEVELSFTSAIGSEASGVRTHFTSVSPRLLLRNKALLQ
jgi:prepilin-type N-terminal cleavage/methylation domain-containing protein